MFIKGLIQYLYKKIIIVPSYATRNLRSLLPIHRDLSCYPQNKVKF